MGRFKTFGDETAQAMQAGLFPAAGAGSCPRSWSGCSHVYSAGVAAALGSSAGMYPTESDTMIPRISSARAPGTSADGAVGEPMHPGILSVTYGYLPNGTTYAEAEAMISQYNADLKAAVTSEEANRMTDILPPSLNAPLSRFRPTCIVLVAHIML